jgi:hypothetical protein
LAPVTARFVASVVVDAESGFAVPGDYIQLEARAMDAFGKEIPNTRFSWTSTNTALATVDDGLVRAIQPGVVGITAVADGVVGRHVLTIMIIPPVLQELLPTTVAAGMPTTMTVWGHGFYRGSVVKLNGQSLPTTYVNGSLLRVAIAGEDIPLRGAYVITVYNAIPGAGMSNPLSFDAQ